MQKQGDEEPALLIVKTCEVVQLTEATTKKVVLDEGKVWPDMKTENEKVSNAWYLYTGASNHMTGEKENFVKLDEMISGSVNLGMIRLWRFVDKEVCCFNAKIKNTRCSHMYASYHG